MSEAGGGLFYPDSAEEEMIGGMITPDMLSRVMGDVWGSERCDSCTCCTQAGCVPERCGEDDYGRFHCPCTSE